MLKICLFMTIAVIPFVRGMGQAGSSAGGKNDIYDGTYDFTISMLKKMEFQNTLFQSQIFSPHIIFRLLLETYVVLKLDGHVAQSLKGGLRLKWDDQEIPGSISPFLITEEFKAAVSQRSIPLNENKFEFNSATRLYCTAKFKSNNVK